MLIQNKVFLVTGGANGVGRELSLLLLRMGASVCVVDLNEEAINQTKALTQEFAEKISFHHVDITDLNRVNLLPDEVIKIHGQIDGIINNAGIIQPFVKVNELDINKAKKVFDVNFFGMFYMVKAFLPHLLKRPEANITNISSMGGFLPVPGQTVYGASKAATKLFTEGLYAELKDTQTHVLVVFPGAIETGISKNSGVEINLSANKEQPKYKMTSAKKAAEVIIKAIEKNKFRARIGSDTKFMDRFYRLAPKKATHLIANKMADLLK